MKTATMRLYGIIGGGFFPDEDAITAKGVAAELDKLRADGVKRLEIFLSSDGGHVGEGLAIYSQIQRFPGEVTVSIDGRALSIASVIALAGNRLVMPRSALLMIHAPFMISIGNSKELRKVADDLDVMAATMRGIYAAASGRPPAEIEKMMDEETWLTAERAQELGFADEVLEDQKPGAAASVRTPILDFYRKTPEGLRGVRAEVALAKLEGLLMRQRIGGIARSASAAAAGVIPGAGN